MTTVDPIYGKSTAVAKLQAIKNRQSPRLACLDVDGTLTGQPAIQAEVRSLLEKQGYVIVFLTARTPELCMSGSERRRADPTLFTHLTTLPAVHRSPWLMVDPATVETFNGLLDPDIIASLGGAIAVKGATGYARDETHHQLSPSDDTAWQNAILREVHHAAGAQAAHISVVPLRFRLQLDFASAAAKDEVLGRLEKELADPHGPPAVVIDNTHPGDPEPQYTAFVVSPHATKEAMLNRVVSALTALSGLPQQPLDLLIAGDGQPDAQMGLSGAPDTHATFLIPAGARLTAYLKRQYGNQLQPHAQPGWYTFTPTGRTVIIGDEAYPGTEAVSTMRAWLGD